MKRKTTADGSREFDSPVLTEMNYHELADLGPRGSEKTKTLAWQFRSEIADYDRIGRPLQKYLVRLFRWTEEYRKTRANNWREVFKRAMN